MPRTKTRKRVYSAHEVANICGVVNQTAISWIERGHLEAYRTPGGQYRIYPDVLARFLREQGIRLPDDLRRILEEEARIENVLIINDDLKLFKRLQEHLKKHYPGSVVVHAEDVFDAGKQLPTLRPDLVICDDQFDGTDGYEVCRKIKNDDDLIRPIVILLVDSESDKTEQRAREVDADAVAPKPVELTTLTDLIRDAMERRVASTSS